MDMTSNLKSVLVISGVVIVVITMIVFAVVYVRAPSESDVNLNHEITNSVQNDKDIVSRKSFERLNFSIDIPNGYETTDRFNTVTVTSPEGRVISIDRIGTNYSSLEDYVVNHRNNLESKIANKDSTNINNFEAISGFIDNARSYFIYANFQVYSFSTSDLRMYDDLDKIVQSFQYID